MIFRRAAPRWRLRFFLFFLVMLGALWIAGLAGFVAAIPRQVEDQTQVTDAIVVLTGGTQRLREGFALLADKRAERLFVSGVYRGVDVDELLRMVRQEPGALECCVQLGYSADNTEGNATETAVWMEGRGYRSLRLVTASYHMPRSLLEFRRAMPAATIVPHPVFPGGFRLDAWWYDLLTLRLLLVEYHKYALAEARATILPRRT